MKLVFLYGPPAVGKLTVGRELAKLTGFRLFDNHVSVDFAKSLFDFGTSAFWRMVDRIRKDAIEDAAKENVDLIFTFVYSRGDDDRFVGEIARRVESHGGEVLPVRLHCNRRELARRIGNKSRKKRGKLTAKAKLDDLFKKYDLEADVSVGDGFSLDTTKLSPRRAAKEIASHHRLPHKG